MRLRPNPDVRTARLEDGGLVLLSEHSGTLYRCNATAAAMWAALREGDGQLDAAAESVADLYGVELARIRADLDRLVTRWQRAGLVSAEDS